MNNSQKLPSCICSNNQWKGAGGSYGPDLNQTNYRCSCGKFAQFLSDYKNNIFYVFLDDSEETMKIVNTWANDTLLVTWRDYTERLKPIQKEIEDRWQKYAYNEIDLPVGEKIPKEKYSQWQDFWNLLQKYKPYSNPVAVAKITTPPKLPRKLEAYVLVDDVWKKVDHEESAKQAVPADPIRTNHDKYYNEVLDKLRAELGIHIETEYVPNEYCGAKNEPWFKFSIGENTIVVGPRKRVTTIKLFTPEGEGKKFNAEKIRNMAIQTKVTYSGNGHWMEKENFVQNLEIHAWNKEQLLGFLTILCEQSLEAFSV